MNNKNGFLEGETGVSERKAKKESEEKHKKTKNQEGLGPSEVAFRATSPDP